MKAKSVNNCYCGHHDTPSHRGNQNHARKNRKRSSVLTLASNINERETKDSNYVTKMAMDEQHGYGGCKETCSSSPILSPETSNALDHADRIMKDAQLQIAEINANHNRHRYRRNRNLYSEDLPLDDEREELLYIRERVVNKFEETDVHIIDYCPVHENLKRYSEDENFRPNIRKTVDLSAPKYTGTGNCPKKTQQAKTFEDQKRVSMEPVEGKNSHSSMKVTDDLPLNTQRTGNIKDISTPRRKHFVGSGLKMSDKYCIQTGPVLTIQRELKAQNLDNIHISPDPSFVKDNSNVGTYEFQYDPYKKVTIPVRKEKFIKIIESKENDINIVNTTTRSRGKEMPDEIRENSNSKEARLKHAAGLPKLSTNSLQKSTANSVAVQHPENTPEDTNQNGNIFHENKDISEAPTLNDVILPEIGEKITIDKVPDLKKEINKNKVVELQRISSPEKITIDPTVFEPVVHNIKESHEIEQCHSKQTDKQNECFQLQGNTSNEAKNNQLVDEVVTPPAVELKEQEKETNQEYNSSREYEDRRRQLEARYNFINNRFENILKFNDNKRRIIPTNSSQFEFKDIDTSASSGELESFEDINLYHPSIDKLDNVLIAYDKIIGGIARESKSIDTFLSLLKFTKYRIVDDKTTLQSSVSNDSLSVHNKSQGNSIDEYPSRHLSKVDGIRSNNSHIKDQLIATNQLLQSREDALRKLRKSGHARTAIDTALSNNEREVKRTYNFKKPVHKTEFTDGSREVEPYKNRRIFDHKSNKGQKQSIRKSFNDKTDVLFKDASRIGHFSKRLREEQTKREIDLSQSASDRSDVTISSIDATNPSVENEILNESSHSRKDITRGEIKDAQQHSTNSIQLHKTPQSDSLRQVLLSKGDSSDIIKYCIGYLMEDKKWDIGNKITSNSKGTEIDPIMIKNCFENCQNIMHNLESINAKHDVLKRMITRFTDKKSGSNAGKDLVLELPSYSEASCAKNDLLFSAAESSRSNENIVIGETPKKYCECSETSVLSRSDHASIINNGAPIHSGKQCAPYSKNEDCSIRSKINRTVSEVESLDDISKIISGENHSKETVENTNSKNKEFPSTIGNIEKNENDITKSRTTKEGDSDRTRELKIMVYTENVIENQNDCTMIKDTKTCNEISTNIVDKEINIVKENSPRETGKDDEISAVSERSKKLQQVDNETEIIGKPELEIHSTVKTDTDDSLKDCTPLESSISSKKNHATSLKTPEVCNKNISVIQRKDTEECSKTNNECTSQVEKIEIVNQSKDQSNDQPVNKAYDDKQKNLHSKLSRCENVSSVEIDLSVGTPAMSTKDVCRDVLYSKLGVSKVSHVNKKSGSTDDVSETKTSKSETSSDTSHSEGELYVSSSCSYSLGEVRIIRRNDLIAQVTTECKQCILVTKNMLTSVNDSPSTLAESIGEI